MAEDTKTPIRDSKSDDSSPSRDPRAETAAETAFYCSAPFFCVQKEGEPRVVFDNRWLVTTDKDLIKYVQKLSNEFRHSASAQPITLMEVPVESVGVEPSPEAVSDYHKPKPPASELLREDKKEDKRESAKDERSPLRR